MTVERGKAWGSEGQVPPDTPVVDSDAGLAALAALSSPPAVVALDGGDIWRTLGGRGDVRSRLGASAWIAPVDIATVWADGVEIGPMAGHVVVRGRWWLGPGIVVMNAQWQGERDIAPRSHPGDGRLDAISGQLRWRELLAARDRVKRGDHLPHPDLTVQRAPEIAASFDPSRLLIVDGVSRGRCRELVVRVTGSIDVVV